MTRDVCSWYMTQGKRPILHTLYSTVQDWHFIYSLHTTQSLTCISSAQNSPPAIHLTLWSKTILYKISPEPYKCSSFLSQLLLLSQHPSMLRQPAILSCVAGVKLRVCNICALCCRNYANTHNKECVAALAPSVVSCVSAAAQDGLGMYKHPSSCFPASLCAYP